MKILCLTTRLDRPSTRYRLLQYLPYINSSGIEADVVVISKGVKRWYVLRGASKYNGVFIQKKLFSRIELWYLRRKAKKIIYDFDDAIMYAKSKFSTCTKRYKRFRKMMDIANLVIAGNRYLAEITGSKYAEKIIVIPTVVDVVKYPLHSRSNSNITLGWIGTRSTQGYLDIIKPVLEKLISKYNKLKVKIVSDYMPDFCGNNIIWEKWDENKELTQLLGFDIGLMPLKEDSWTKGKCGFKIIQYMAAGIPVVCSPVGVNTEIVKDGINGFFASAPDEWEIGVSRLVDDIDLYKKMSVASRIIVDKNYNLAYWGPYLSNLIKEKIC